MTKSVGIAALALFAIFAASSARAEDAQTKTVVPDSLTFNKSPTGATVAVVNGSMSQSGSLYVLSVKYAVGTKGVPHTHPDERVMTVISGTFYAGTGPQIDESAATPVTAGTSVAIPANVVHWGFAKDGDVLIQEVGSGPTGTKVWPKVN